MILVLDNYDSFVFNLVQYLGTLGEQTCVVRNDALSLTDIELMAPELIVISPGPGDPEDAGVSLAAVRHFAGRIPIFGVCLGHQAIGAAFGGRVVHAKTPMHGKTSVVAHDGRGAFTGLPERISVMRYHSLALDPDSLRAELEVTAVAEDGEVMAVRHRSLAVEGVQFHPESIFTEHGMTLVSNAMSSLRSAGARTRHPRQAQQLQVPIQAQIQPQIQPQLQPQQSLIEKGVIA
jgi:anthranilate synthase component 2